MNTSNIDLLTPPKKATKFHKKQHKAFLRKLGMEPLFNKFNKEKLFWALMNENVMVFDFIQGDFEMPPHVLTQMEVFFYFYCYNIMLPIPGAMRKFSLYEVIELSRRFKSAYSITFAETSKVFKQCDKWEKAFWDKDMTRLTVDYINRGLIMTCYIFTSLDSWIYGYNVKIEPHPTNNLKMREKITILRQKADVYNRTEKVHRRYYRLEHDSGAGNFEYKSGTYQDSEYPIYLQNHALKRMEERIHLRLSNLQYTMLLCVKHDDVQCYKGSYQIPVYAEVALEHKVGYLVGEIVENRLLINTFLFLSQDGTPEGDMLNEQLRVNKLEKEFLQLDELRFFTNSDLKDDEELVSILKLCKLDHLMNITLKDPSMGYTRNAEFIKEMIPLNPNQEQSTLCM